MSLGLFLRFLQIHGRLSFLTDGPPPFGDTSHTSWFIEDQAIRAWLLKLAILSIGEPMRLITLTKAIWDEWASMYGYESNISRIVEVYE